MSKPKAQLELEALTFEIGKQLRAELGTVTPHDRGLGFALLIFDFGANGFCAYTGNADREDTIRLLREHLRMLEAQAPRRPNGALS